ncbi:hypothetical protein [Delftia sp.]|uniref:hypothetical protein n=1 Tax=Delftia sp. TaxID=1886637 RepID=UPI00257E51B1|nr:hypothetical protein [Delftia sp.]
MAMPMPGLASGADMVLATRVTAGAKPWLTPAHRQWLQARGPLTLGISTPDHPPLGMIDGDRFQGITADHLGLLFPTPVRFKSYGSRAAVLDALRRGEIDLACGGTELEAERADLALSVPYLPRARAGLPVECSLRRPAPGCAAGHDARPAAALPGGCRLSPQRAADL